MIDWEQQAQGKTCNKCGKNGLTWDKEFHTKTGKWKLENHKREDGKWCNKPPEVTINYDHQLCELCSGTSFGLIHSKKPEDLEEHTKMWHPNGEPMTELDFKMHHGMPKFYLKYWVNDPHYHKYT